MWILPKDFAFQWVLDSSQWDHMQMNYVITFMFYSDTLAVQQLSLKTVMPFSSLS